MYNKGETKRHGCKLLLPRGDSQRKSLEWLWREEWRKSSWLSQPLEPEGSREAEQHKRSCCGCSGELMQGWTAASGTGCIFGEENLIPPFCHGFIHNSAAQAQGFQLLGCICSFPLCSMSVPAGLGGVMVTPHLQGGVLQSTPYTARSQSPLRE